LFGIILQAISVRKGFQNPNTHTMSAAAFAFACSAWRIAASSFFRCFSSSFCLFLSSFLVGPDEAAGLQESNS
jgi:hypothetical protein